MNHFEAVLPQTRFSFNHQVPDSTPKSQSFDHMVSDSDMPVYDDYGVSDNNGHFNDAFAGLGNKARRKPESRWSFRTIGKTNKMSQDSDALFTTTSPHVASSGSRKANGTSVSGDGARTFDDLDPFGSSRKSMSSFSSLKTDTGKEGSPLRTQGPSEHPSHSSKETAERLSGRSPGGHSERKLSGEDNRGSPRSFFKIPSVFTNSRKSFRQASSSPTSRQVKSNDKCAHVDTPPCSLKSVESSDDVWLTVSEVPLFTQPTRAPPPSRPPPPPPVLFPKTRGSSIESSSAKKIHEFSSFQDLNGHSGDHNSFPMATRSSTAPGVDDFKRVAMGRSRNTSNDISCDEVGKQPETSASATTVKEAMDRVETKFHHAKGMSERERDSTRNFWSKDSAALEKVLSRQDAEEISSCREQKRLEQGQLQKEKEEGEHWKLEKERERKEKEDEQRRLEKERERGRQAVERATREARERAAAEARLKAEKAAREKANAEARRLAERAAVQRAQTEARERAAALAKERAEKVAAEAREQEAREKAFEAQMKAEKAAVERAVAEAREKAAAEAQEKVAAAAKAPKFSSKQSAKVAKASAATASRLREAASVANSVDGLFSVFDAGGFREFENESEERRRARLERHHRTQERTARALAEKNQRDLQAQREQEERQRIAESLDIEIKRWAAGKEGNLRALLATLQYVLWPECGWQPVSLTDLMTGASVKKVYRKATLCIHPDKVQQKGANLQQKYIAEKVFDLLKEAWNRFNSEELF